MTHETTKMRAKILQIPDAVDRLLTCGTRAIADAADALARKGARVFTLAKGTAHATRLPHVLTGNRFTAPIAALVSFHGMIETVATGRGINPDAPRHLDKVTETV